MALLSKTEHFKYKDLAKDVLLTPEPIEKAVQSHEIMGHLYLTKRSSFWALLFISNYASHLAQYRLLKILEKDVVENHQDIFKTDLLDLLSLEEFVRVVSSMWRPVQEVRANVYLIAAKEKIDDEEIKKKYEKLIELNNNESDIIKKLTGLSEIILDGIGIDNGLKFLDTLTIIASNPSIIMTSETPQEIEDLKKAKREAYEHGKRMANENPSFLDPTIRLIEILGASLKLIDEINNALKRNKEPGELAMNISSLCGHQIESLDSVAKKVNDYFKAISKNINLSESRRAAHKGMGMMMEVYLKILNAPDPTFWFVNDRNSDKIYFAPSKVAREVGWLESYLHFNVMKYQFVKSLREGKDLIECFENKLLVCKSSCKSCIMNATFQSQKKLLRIVNEKFTYPDLMKEAIDKRRIENEIFGFFNK